jgi:O-methyltransferase involved in polyketide biosynthesis
MTGHAFQVLLTDDAIRAALANVRRHLAPGGRLAFETRNPAARAWERWTPPESRTTAGGYDVWHEVTAVDGELVTFVATFRSAAATLSSTSTLRFAGLDRLRALLAEAGLRVDEEYGSWDRSPIGPESPELVLVSSAAA